MSVPYAKRVQAETPSGIHVNNPTPLEAKEALAFDVIAATTNPTYVGRMLSLDSEREVALKKMDEFIAVEKDDHVVLEKLEMAMVKRIADLYLPVYEQTNGRRGLVFIQGNPFHDNEADYKVAEALRFFEISPNIVVKLPSNAASLIAFRELTAMNRNLCATSGLSISQEEAYYEAYNQIHKKDGKWPVLYVTTLAGILDEFIKKYVAEHNIQLSEDALDKAGNLFSKLAYKMVVDRGYKGILQGGGARHLKHFTELVGSAFESTVNYVFIEQMNAENPPIVSRYQDFYSDAVRRELLEKLPFYRQTIEPGAMKPEEFDTYEPFVYFRSTFTTAWSKVIDAIAQRRTGK